MNDENRKIIELGILLNVIKVDIVEIEKARINKLDELFGKELAFKFGIKGFKIKSLTPEERIIIRNVYYNNDYRKGDIGKLLNRSSYYFNDIVYEK